MKVNVEQAIEILSRTPEVLKVLLSDLPETWTQGDEGPDTWSPYDVLGHFIHGEETDWMTRAKIMLEHGEKRPFEPFDRFAQFEKSKGKSIQALLEQFADLRRKNLEKLERMHLSGSDLNLTGTHPELGTVNLGQLIASWVVHDFNHVRQVVEVMARQYADEVGPWKAYLPIVGD